MDLLDRIPFVMEAILVFESWKLDCQGVQIRQWILYKANGLVEGEKSVDFLEWIVLKLVDDQSDDFQQLVDQNENRDDVEFSFF